MQPHTYPLTETRSARSLKFFFVSRGTRTVVKAVEYDLYQKFRGKDVYNLGFGDYDAQADTFCDGSNSNNGDVYKVFHTVLHTIPLFFGHHPQALLMVQGSDNTAAFLEHCLATCTQNCRHKCLKFGRRMAIYRNFVNKYLDTWADEYDFWGGMRNAQGKIVLEKYRKGREYNAIMFGIKIVNLGVVNEPEGIFITMKPKAQNQQTLSDAELLAPIIAKFKGKTLFPRLVENGKKILENAEFVKE